jgi:hypothetical protein
VTLVLYRWHLDAAGDNPRAERRRLVDAVVIPVFRDTAVLASADCLYAGKYGPPQELDEVRLTLLAEQRVGAQAAAAVEAHLGGERVTHRVGPAPGDRLCRPDCARYRRRLMDVTRIALDLHGDPAHRGALLAMWCPPNNAALHAYLAKHSPAYQELCNTGEARAAFWQDFWAPGPSPGLSHPGHWIENVVLVE